MYASKRHCRVLFALAFASASISAALCLTILCEDVSILSMTITELSERLRLIVLRTGPTVLGAVAVGLSLVEASEGALEASTGMAIHPSSDLIGSRVGGLTKL